MQSGQKVLSCEEGLGQVWISGVQFASDLDALQKQNIRAVCSGYNFEFKYPQNLQHLNVDIMDTQAQQIDHLVDQVYTFIETNRKKSNVLVHCIKGVSRCSMLLILYMIKKYKLSYQACLEKVKGARSCCQPNNGFATKLAAYQKRLGIE